MSSTSDYITEAIISLLSRFVLDKIMAAILTNIPFLATGPVGFIVKTVLGHFITKVVRIIAEEISLGIQIMGARWEVNAQNARYVRAYAKKERAESVKEKELAEKELEQSFYDFIEFNRLRASVRMYNNAA